MVDILEFIEDLEKLQTLAGSSCSPRFASTINNMLKDYKERAWLTEQRMAQELEEHSEFKSEPESVYLSREDAEWYAEKAKEDLALWDGSDHF